jgi:hypothetical protein
MPLERFIKHEGRLKLTPTNFLSMLLPFLSFVPDLDWRILDTYNYLSPRFASRHTYDEVIEWFKESGFINIKRLPIPVSVMGKRQL